MTEEEEEEAEKDQAEEQRKNCTHLLWPSPMPAETLLPKHFGFQQTSARILQCFLNHLFDHSLGNCQHWVSAAM